MLCAFGSKKENALFGFLSLFSHTVCQDYLHQRVETTICDRGLQVAKKHLHFLSSRELSFEKSCQEDPPRTQQSIYTYAPLRFCTHHELGRQVKDTEEGLFFRNLSF